MADNFLDAGARAVIFFVRPFWEFCSLCVFCSGAGGWLAGFAWLDLGVMDWPVFWFLWTPLCAYLTWLSYPIRRRYERWIRHKDQPTGELK